jgi:magnesium-transporting ATPase (P-type)
VLGLLTLTFGDWRDALFLGIIVTNTGIGIWQELRASRSSTRWRRSWRRRRRSSGTAKPRLLSLRGGGGRPHPTRHPGDQVVADGLLLTSSRLRLDESILTGESAAHGAVEG